VVLVSVLYIVQVKRYSVAQARIHFSHLLDAAEAGDPVVIERRGVRFRLQSDRRGKSRTAARHSIVEYVDPTVLEGQWTWAWAEGGLRFVARRQR
jgi:prevent-host-death family protein